MGRNSNPSSSMTATIPMDAMQATARAAGALDGSDALLTLVTSLLSMLNSR